MINATTMPSKTKVVVLTFFFGLAPMSGAAAGSLAKAGAVSIWGGTIGPVPKVEFTGFGALKAEGAVFRLGFGIGAGAGVGFGAIGEAGDAGATGALGAGVPPRGVLPIGFGAAASSLAAALRSGISEEAGALGAAGVDGAAGPAGAGAAGAGGVFSAAGLVGV